MSRWLGVLVAVVLAACAEEKRAPWFDATKYRNEPRREAIERGDKPRFELCDILEEDCQSSVFDNAAETYGADAARPRTSVVTEEEFIAFAEDLSSPEDLEAAENSLGSFLRMLILLGMVSPTLSVDSFTGEASADGIAAAYFFGPKEVLVIDLGMDTDGEFAVYVLSHEYVHALQDASYDLTRFHRRIRSTDTKHAVLGLVEGEAEVYASLAVYGEAQDSADKWRSTRKKLLEGALGDLAPFFAADVSFPYLLGTEFVTFAWLAGGNQAVADLYGAVPASSREILAGAGAEPPPGGWVDTVDDTADSDVAPGFAPVFADSFGAWIFHVFLEQMAAASGASDVRLPGESVATDLRGDEVIAFERDNTMVAVWRLRFEPDVAPADVISEISAGAPSHFRLREEGGEVLLFAGESDEALDEFETVFSLPSGGAATARAGAPAQRPWAWGTPSRRGW